jgi:hypothetical protein
VSGLFIDIAEEVEKRNFCVLLLFPSASEQYFIHLICRLNIFAKYGNISAACVTEHEEQLHGFFVAYFHFLFSPHFFAYLLHSSLHLEKSVPAQHMDNRGQLCVLWLAYALVYYPHALFHRMGLCVWKNHHQTRSGTVET